MSKFADIIAEMRKIAQELDVTIITATQPNCNRGYRSEPQLSGTKCDFVIIDDIGLLRPQPSFPALDNLFD